MSDKAKEKTPSSGEVGQVLEQKSNKLASWFHKGPVSTSSKSDGLFVDPAFPMRGITEWRRPKEISPQAQFIVAGATRMDVCQGGLNDCWFLSAIASLSLYRPLLERVVPADQSFQKGYTGRFCFQFWQYGEWQKVEIDDMLPTRDGQLMYMSSSDKTEFWSALLEKAYAKLKGGYRALCMGLPHEAMVDMTGGVTEVMIFSALPRELGPFLKGLLDKGALLNCAITNGPVEEKNPFGLLCRHAYSVTGFEQVQTKYGPVELVRAHNPWGKTEWEGPWSDMNGPEWGQVSVEEQQRLNRVQAEDGEFWMSLSDFRQNFDMMEVCHLTVDTLAGPGSTDRPWHMTLHQGVWAPPKWGKARENPMYHLILLEEDDDPSDPELTCSFLVALMQKHERVHGLALPIGLEIFKCVCPEHAGPSKSTSPPRPLLSTQNYARRREVVLRGRLAPGNYCIVPSTLEPNRREEFIVRVLTEKGNVSKPAIKIKSVEKEPPTSPPDSTSVLPSTEMITQLYKKHCNEKGLCSPLRLLNLLTEVIQAGVLAGTEKHLCLEHCKSFVVLMDNCGMVKLDWDQFQALWVKIKMWTDIFVKADVNKSRFLDFSEVKPALEASGMGVDEFILQLISLRYTEPDMTVSYPGFLFLMLKLDRTIQKFQAYDVMGMGTISVNYRQWLHMTMYN